MSERNALHALAERAGIARSYAGYDGRTVEVPDSTCETLLHALGIDASSERAAEQALGAQDQASANQLIAPVRVLRVGSPELGSVQLQLGATPRGPLRVRFELRLDSG